MITKEQQDKVKAIFDSLEWWAKEREAMAKRLSKKSKCYCDSVYHPEGC